MNKQLEKLKDYWKDPVWSKVISAGIIAICAFVLTKLYEVVVKVPFKNGFQSIFNYIFRESLINNGILLAVSLILILIILNYSAKIIRYVLNFSNSLKKDDSSDISVLPFFNSGNTADFFSMKLGKAFPGVRGLKWFNNPVDATKRLEKLFEKPLSFRLDKDGNSWITPIWCYRNLSAYDIHSFKLLKSFFNRNIGKALLNTEELNIHKIAVYISPRYYHSFVYVEVTPSKQIGLYKLSDENIKKQIENIGYSFEEFALFKGNPITLEEYNDGATVFKGKLVDISKVELRTRYLSKYNFIVAANESAFNVNDFEFENNCFLDLMFKGEKNIEELISKVDACHKSNIIRRY